jgi:hypothetical protein
MGGASVTIKEIYKCHNRGAPAFVREVLATRAFDMSASEARCLGIACATPEAFEAAYLFRAFWRDDFEPRKKQETMACPGRLVYPSHD